MWEYKSIDLQMVSNPNKFSSLMVVAFEFKSNKKREASCLFDDWLLVIQVSSWMSCIDHLTLSWKHSQKLA